MTSDPGDYAHLLDWFQEGAFVSRSEEETLSLAERLGSQLTGKEVLLLVGELGAGKTVFAKGVGLGAGVSDITCICSPTFTLATSTRAVRRSITSTCTAWRRPPKSRTWDGRITSATGSSSSNGRSACLFRSPGSGS